MHKRRGLIVIDNGSAGDARSLRVMRARPSTAFVLHALWLLAATLSACAQETWESAMQAGHQAVQRGDYPEAERIYAAAVTKAEAFGRKDRRVAVTLSELAHVYATQGKYVEAEPAYLRALEIYQDVHGEAHPDVAATLNNLGVLHRMHGQYAQAEPLLERALAIKEKVLGRDHPDVALGLSNLAMVHVAQGHYAQAEPLYQRALAIREKALGAEHPDVAKSLEDYAAMLRKARRSDDAAKLEERATAIRSKQGRASAVKPQG
ncbi:MAG: tetratricopeptide repeat protein [Nitrospirota bacterium]